MSWLVWFALGTVLGWWAAVLFWKADTGTAQDGIPQVEQPEPPPQTFLWGLLAGLLLSGTAGAQADRNVARDEGAEVTPAEDQAAAVRPGRAAYAVFFIVLAIAVLFAVAHHFRVFGGWLFATEAFLLSPRVVALASGMAAGCWARHYRVSIARHLSGFYEALLGTETKSSWPLQAAVALVALFAILLAIKPDLLDHIESLRAGDIEAKFASASATTREAGRVALVPFRSRDTLAKYTDFTIDFRRPDSGRGIALELYDGSSIKKDRIEIRDILFEGYIEPFTTLLSCIQRNGRIDEFRREMRLTEFALIFRNKIINEGKEGSGAEFRESDWLDLLERFDKEIAYARKIVEKDIKNPAGCELGGNFPSFEVFLMRRRLEERWERVRRKVDSERLAELVERARGVVATSRDERAYRLSHLDPYIIGAAGDLLSLTLGDTEKANFLTVIKRGYPTDLRFVQPGLVNLHYQLADSKISREEPWPVDDQIGDLAQALRLTEHLLARSRADAQEAEARYIRALEAENRTIRGSFRDRKNIKVFQKFDYGKVIDVYLANTFLIMSKYIEIFVQRTLAGDPLTDEHRRMWVALYRDLEGLLNMRAPYTRLESVDAAERMLSGRERDEWNRAETGIKSADDSMIFFFEARANMALSAVMLTEKRRVSPSQACAVSRTHLAVADQSVRDVIRELKGDLADEARLRGYIQQVRARIDASCRP